MNNNKIVNSSHLPSWDLCDLYENINSSEIVLDLQLLQTKTTEFNKDYKGKVTTLTADSLYAAIKLYEEITSLCLKLETFARLTYVVDLSNSINKAFFQQIEEKLNSFQESLVFFPLELNTIPSQDLERMLKIDLNLSKYQPWLEKARIWKKHELSEPEEKILLQKELSGTNAWIKFYDNQISKLRFKFNNSVLTLTQIQQKLISTSAEERKNAAQSIERVLKKNADTFAFILNTIIKDKELDDIRRGFKYPISARNLSNYVDDKIVTTLISTVKENYPRLSHRYYKIKAKLLNKSKLDYWDRNAPISEELKSTIQWDKAMDIVLTAYNNFSPTAGHIAKTFFDKNWIDANVAPYKMHGAFAHPGSSLAHPYIMMNYQETDIRSVTTLAHEIGHGIHQVLSNKQGELMRHTPLTLAETASVFGEKLTFYSLLEQEKNPERRKFLIMNKIEDMLNTVVRQIALCEFERKIHDERRKGELSIRDFGKLWLMTQKETFGDAIDIKDSYSYYWIYISHFFHVPFYVYAYAFGDCLVNSLFAIYEKGILPDFESRYLNMLRAGGKFRYEDLTQLFGLDLTDSTFWQQGLEHISSLIDMVE